MPVSHSASLFLHLLCHSFSLSLLSDSYLLSLFGSNLFFCISLTLSNSLTLCLQFPLYLFHPLSVYRLLVSLSSFVYFWLSSLFLSFSSNAIPTVRQNFKNQSSQNWMRVTFLTPPRNYRPTVCRSVFRIVRIRFRFSRGCPEGEKSSSHSKEKKVLGEKKTLCLEPKKKSLHSKQFFPRMGSELLKAVLEKRWSLKWLNVFRYFYFKLDQGKVVDRPGQVFQTTRVPIPSCKRYFPAKLTGLRLTR